MNAPASTTPTRRPGRFWLTLALALPVVGAIAYSVQIWAQLLMAPWYMPILGTFGLVCLVVALWQARTVWRLIALVPVMLLCGAEWAFLLATRQPEYSGPVAVGQPFPVFATLQSDGTPFTQHDLRGERNNILVFFRGRW